MVAVDLDQFRNTEVGRGYRAKHVVRQRTAGHSETIQTVHNHTNIGADRGKSRESASTKTAIETKDLLRNDGLRAFRKEIESILASS